MRRSDSAAAVSFPSVARGEPHPRARGRPPAGCCPRSSTIIIRLAAIAHQAVSAARRTLIGKNPFRIEAIWQEAYIAWFYPPGREKTHALGALDLALWDIKGKALKLPVHELLGGTARDYCECYATGGAPTPAGTKLSLKERARATMEAGYRAFRMGAADVPIGDVFDTRSVIRRIAQDCREVREGVGTDGNWCIDLHQRFDFNDAVRACKVMEEFEPFFVEDPVRDENALQDIPKLRPMTTVPLTHGEEWGLKWDFNRLVENHDIDFIRSTLPNIGGITEMMKAAAICETHAVGIIPHFTGPIATAALVNCLSTFAGPVLMDTTTAAGRSTICRNAWISRTARRIRINARAWASPPR